MRRNVERRLGAMEDKVAMEAGLRAALDRDLSALQTKLDGANRLIQAVADTQSEHTTRLRSLDDRMTVVSGNVVDLAAGVAGLAGHMSGMDTRMDGLDTRVDHLTGRFTALEDRYAAQEARLDNHQEQLQAINERLTGVDERLAGVDGKLDLLIGLVQGPADEPG